MSDPVTAPTPLTPPEVGGPVVEAEKPSSLDRVIGTLPPVLQAQYRLQQLERQVQSAIAAESWGKKLDTSTRHAIAQFCNKYSIDVTEIDVLGGNIYRNARFYLARLARLNQVGEIEYAYADHITADPRLDVLAPDQDPEFQKQLRAESQRRFLARTEYGITDEALCAVVYRVKHRKMDREIVGVKAVYRSEKDPIGTAKPVETAETRAARRCLRQLIPNVTGNEGALLTAMDADWEVLEKRAQGALKKGEPEQYRPVKSGNYDEDDGA